MNDSGGLAAAPQRHSAARLAIAAPRLSLRRRTGYFRAIDPL
jgi:hypothetical protein